MLGGRGKPTRSMFRAQWDENSATNVLDRIVNLQVTICGFSFERAWIGVYKSQMKKTTHKSKGIRKQF